MNSHGLTKENLVATLPVALQKDPSAVALAESMAELLARRPAEIDRLLIYPAVDRLGESLLDILAYDFKVDWWDPNYSLEEKRRTLKSSWRVHKLLGTKAAVETALSAVYAGAEVEEWFEYGGEPYHFRIHVKVADAEYETSKHKRVLDRVAWYKNLRSHMDRIRYELPLVVFENPERFVFVNFKVPLRASNYDLIRLNGEAVLDGGWRLDQRPGNTWFVGFETIAHTVEQPGALLVRAMRTGTVCRTESDPHVQSVGAGVFSLAPVTERVSGNMVPRCAVRERNDAGALKLSAGVYAVRDGGTGLGRVTLRTWRRERFNGTVCFDGSRTFGGGIGEVIEL